MSHLPLLLCPFLLLLLFFFRSSSLCRFLFRLLWRRLRCWSLLDFFATSVFLCPNRQARANPRSPKSSCSLFFLSSSPPVCLPRCVADLLPPYPPPLPRTASAPLHAAVSCGKSVCNLSICSRFRCEVEEIEGVERRWRLKTAAKIAAATAGGQGR
jgi:hypothetical protein